MNKFDEAIKTIQDSEYEINDIGDTLIKLTRNEASEIIDQLELGKLYKEYFEFFEKQFDTDNGYGVTVINIKKKIKELENEN